MFDNFTDLDWLRLCKGTFYLNVPERGLKIKRTFEPASSSKAFNEKMVKVNQINFLNWQYTLENSG